MAFEDLKQRAKRGDPVAQRQLAQIYDSCFIANVRPEYFLSGYEQQAKSLKDASKASKMVQVARERAAECRGVDGGDVIPVELIKGWFEQAARNGDPGAQAMIYALNQKVLDNAEANHFIQNIAGSKDPAAVFLMGEFAGGKGLDAADATYDDIVGGPTTGYAWMVVGCRMGYDCGPSSDLMGTMCLHMQACGDDDFEAFVRSGLRSDDEVEALDRQIEEISRLVDLR